MFFGRPLHRPSAEMFHYVSHKRHPNKNGGRPILAGRINRAKSRISDDENTSSDGIFTESTRVVIAQPLVTRPVRGSTMILSLFSNSPTHRQRRVSEYAVVVRKGSGGAECGCAKKMSVSSSMVIQKSPSAEGNLSE